MSVWCFIFSSSKSHPDTKEQRRLHSSLMPFTLLLSEQTATHSCSLSLSTQASTEHHTLSAGCLLQKRRGGAQVVDATNSLAHPCSPSPPVVISPLGRQSYGRCKRAEYFYLTVFFFFLRGPRKKCSAATNKGHVPASLHPLEQPLIQLHRLSARTKALQSPLISQGPGMRMERGNAGEEKEMAKREGWGCWEQGE